MAQGAVDRLRRRGLLRPALLFGQCLELRDRLEIFRASGRPLQVNELGVTTWTSRLNTRSVRAFADSLA